MKIIVDTNRIIAALIRDGPSRNILASSQIEFYTLDYAIDELKVYYDYIIKKAHSTRQELDLLFALIMENINIIPVGEIKVHMQEAEDIMQKIDIKDAPILACALSLPNNGIWSEDKHFEIQTKVMVWKTKDLLQYI